VATSACLSPHCLRKRTFYNRSFREDLKPWAPASKIGGAFGPHQFCTRNNIIETQRTRSKSNEKTAKSTNPIDILPLITVWLQVRDLPGPPIFIGASRSTRGRNVVTASGSASETDSGSFASASRRNKELRLLHLTQTDFANSSTEFCLSFRFCGGSSFRA
jgi:hypothetical protein